MSRLIRTDTIVSLSMYDLEDKLSDVINNLSNYLDTRDGIYLEIFTEVRTEYGYYEGESDYSYLDIKGKRYETDDEYQKRMKKSRKNK